MLRQVYTMILCIHNPYGENHSTFSICLLELSVALGEDEINRVRYGLLLNGR